MKINRLLTLLPCSSLEDLRLDRKPEEAEELLSAWTALWYPALIAGTKAVPSWLSATDPPQELPGELVILPDCCQSLLPAGWLEHIEASGALVLRGLKCRTEIISAALERLGLGPITIDLDLAADFLALGFCRFVVELLTRKHHYPSTLDEDALRTAVLAAAAAAVQGDSGAARQQLQSAFDRLHEAREHLYPAELHLIDLTLVAPTTLGESLRKEFSLALPHNLLICAEVLQELAQREPESLAALIEALKNNSIAIVSGEFTELPLPLLSPDAIEFHLQRGIRVYQQIIKQRPVIFGRRRFGLCPALPQILAKNGFSSAVHFTLDDGQFPLDNQSRTQWEGFDGTAIEAIGCLPLDANRADCFLRLPEILANALELDTAATVVFAHWPGRVCDWYDDLRRICAFSQVLGAFHTINKYIEQTIMASRRVKYNADQYRSPYLVQDVAAGRIDSISRWVNYYRRRSIWESAQTLHTLAVLTDKKISSETACGFAMKHQELLATLENSQNPNAPVDPELDLLLQQTLNAAGQQFSQSLSGKSPADLSPGSSQSGYLLLNTCSFSQRLGVNLSEFSTPPAVEEPIQAAAENAAMVDLPAMGFAWIGPSEKNSTSAESSERKVWLF